MSALCTVSEVKAYLKVAPLAASPSADALANAQELDGLLALLIEQSSAWIETQTGRRFAAQTYTDERYNAPNGDTLMLRNRPILSVSAVGIGRPGQAPTELVVDRDYFNDDLAIYFFGQFVARGARGFVTVSYRGGYDLIPWDIRQAAIGLSAWAYKESQRIGQTSQVTGGQTVNFDVNPAASRVMKTLQQYTNPAPV